MTEKSLLSTFRSRPVLESRPICTAFSSYFNLSKISKSMLQPTAIFETSYRLRNTKKKIEKYLYFFFLSYLGSRHSALGLMDVCSVYCLCMFFVTQHKLHYIPSIRKSYYHSANRTFPRYSTTTTSSPQTRETGHN